MPIPENPEKSSSRKDRCRRSCLKKYMKPDLQKYQGSDYREKLDSCLAAHYVCCKPDPGDHQDPIEICRERVSQNTKTEES